MSKIALFFGPEGGNVHKVTKELAGIIGNEKVDMVPVINASANDLEKYEKVIFLASAIGLDQWDMKDVKDDWDRFFPELDKVSFDNKVVAIVGLGDHIKYPSHFVTSIASLGEKLTEKGANITGAVSTEGYTYQDTEALNKEGMFYGLPIDEDNEEDLTTKRLNNWVNLIKSDFAI